MKKLPADACDLPILARRGEADAAELRRLQMQHAASQFEHELYTLGTEYDATATEQPEDAARLHKLVSRALGQAEPTRLRHRTVPLTSLLAILALAGVAAAALTLPQRLQQSNTALPPSATTPGAQLVTSICTPPGADLAPAAKAADAASALTPAAAASVAALAAPAASTQLAPVLVETAGELFAKANSQRKAGRSEAAISGYRLLQSRYPRSPEAGLSQVMLARMYVQRGAQAQAEQHFARYLAANNGDLVEESLLGRGDALRALGRTREAKAVLQSLLTRFPRSIYAEPAKQRLKELD